MTSWEEQARQMLATQSQRLVALHQAISTINSEIANEVSTMGQKHGE